MDLRRNLARFAGVMAALIALVPLGCARDVNDPDAADPFPVEVHMAFRTRGTFDAETWYFIVFNFTSTPTTTLAVNPIDRISNEDRADRWEMYIAYNRNQNGEETLVTLQRPRVPTVLPTARGPVDTATGDFDGNEIIDVAVACELDDIVQILRGTPITVIDPVFFLGAEDIETSAGESPIRIHADEMTGDTAVDLLIIYEGGGSPFYRLLPGDPANQDFLAGTDQPLPALPVDAVFGDFNADTETDFAVITTGEGAGDNALRIFTGNGAGVFAEAESIAIADNPRTVALGQLDDGGLDLVVADGGTGSAGSVQVFLNNGDATFDNGPVLPVEGNLRSAAIGTMFGTRGDIVVVFDDPQGQGAVAVFQNEEAAPLAAPAEGLLLDNGNPTYVIVHEAGNDAAADAVFVDGTAEGGQTLYIQRGDREPGATIGDPPTFEWNLETITYITGVGPTRIELADLDGNGVQDFVIPNSFDGAGGNSVSLAYGLGHYNYTNADVFWTDDLPELLVNQEWYISHAIGPNFIELTIDPALFFDLARLPPDRERGFNVTFMTATTAIDIERNPDQLGEVRDFLSAAINVPMQVDFYNDEQNLPLANQNIAPLDSQDIENWLVEVF